eukprot:COSAG01_NODE_666_length_14393_cov_8.519029_10_plen_88_part_00
MGGATSLDPKGDCFRGDRWVGLTPVMTGSAPLGSSRASTWLAKYDMVVGEQAPRVTLGNVRSILTQLVLHLRCLGFSKQTHCPLLAL